MSTSKIYPIIASMALLLNTVNSQAVREDSSNSGPGRRPYTWNYSDTNNPNPNQFNFLTSSPERRALIAHAVIASLVWAFLIPLGSIIVRTNIKSPWVVRAHATLQVLGSILYIIAVGLGIWLIQQLDSRGHLWSDIHPRLGLVILALMLVQPVLRGVNHWLYKKRSGDNRHDKTSDKPGRTVPGQMHIWLGRALIVLGIVNGGLGIRLAYQTPFQPASMSHGAAIAYGVVAGFVFLIYLFVVVRFEVGKARGGREAQRLREVADVAGDRLPTYNESQEALRKQVVVRYA